MKLRIRGNSLRIRVTRGELAQLADSGYLEETIAFGGGRRLGYALRRDGEADTLNARFDTDLITVGIPAAVLRAWASTEEVSLSGEQRLDGGDTLALLVEKDFACLAPREGEDDSDAFPHPLADSGETC